jgi:hypothetical protein
MTDDLALTRRNAGLAVVQALILLGLCAVALRANLTIFRDTVRDPNAAHALAAPLVILVLLLRRRRVLAEELTNGSAWGVVLLGLGIGAYVLATWPFNYGYPRRAAIVPAVAGVILAAGGWRVLKRCLPLLLVLLLAIPTGSRYYAFAIIKPETYTLGAVRATLDLLPGVFVDLSGPDLSYLGGWGTGTIALGEHHRGAALFLAYLTLGVFVTFVRIRPWPHVVCLGAVAPLIALLANYARLIMWGLITIYGRAHPLSAVPRLVSSAAALLLAWGLFVAVAAALRRILVEVESPDG